MENLLDVLMTLVKIKSPTGKAYEAINFVKEELDSLGIETRFTNKKALIATIKGEDDENQVTYSAHCDTLGAMVKEIKDNGRLKLCQIGSYAWNSIEGEYVEIDSQEGSVYTGTVLINNASCHVHCDKTSTTERNSDNIEVRIDEDVHNAEDVRNLGIEIGDFVCMDPRPVLTESGYFKSRHLDDKACVAILVEMARIIVNSGKKPPRTINLFFSNYEEVGHGASASIPEKTKEFVVVDMAAPGTGQTSDERKVTICAKDSSGPYDFELKERLIQLARERRIDYAVDIYPCYGSDGSAALRAGHDIKVCLIGPGVDASHSMERTHVSGLENTLKLALAFAGF